MKEARRRRTPGPRARAGILNAAPRQVNRPKLGKRMILLPIVSCIHDPPVADILVNQPPGKG